MRRRRPFTVAFVVAGLALMIDLWDRQALLSTQVAAIALAAFACSRYGVRPWAYLGAPPSPQIIGGGRPAETGPQFADSWTWSVHTLD